MDCPNWPPPLPSLPLYPPCRPATPATPPPPPPPVVKPIRSQTQEWWDENLGALLNRLSGSQGSQRGTTFELTRRQRRELLPIRTPTKQDKLIWSVPLPEGSFPSNGLPIWERLYLDRKLPMLKCPPNSLVFARQRIGKKLWKDTGGQEFILYDPHSYEMSFTYENVHDPHLTTYYEGKEIRGFLLKLGDATEDGWGLCSLQRFNQYRKYLKRVHLSLVHTEMERQEALKDEIHKMKEYKQTTDETMAAMERKVMVDEVRASIVEALRQYRLNKINRLLASLQEKEERVRKLYRKRERERELQRQKGLKLLAEQELKNKIASEIKRRKKIATLRRWHDTEQKTMRLMKKQADERVRQKAEKVRIRWQNKIDNLKKMFEVEDNFLQLQQEVRKRNIEIRNAHNERMKQQEKDRFQEIRKESLRKKALIRREREDKRMEKAIIEAWIRINTKDCDINTELYRVRKSINSTMAELLTTQMEGPDRLSIILMSRNRIQREQKIPIQVSFAIDAVLETTIQNWANIRILFLLETVVAQVKENGRMQLADIKARHKDLGIQVARNFKAGDPRGNIFQPDPKEKKPLKQKCQKKQSLDQTLESTTGDLQNQGESSEKKSEKDLRTDSGQGVNIDDQSKVQATVVPNYVHYGPVTTHEYPFEYDPQGKLKPVAGRPKTPMPSQEELCEAGFLEEKLNDILPTLKDDVMNLKEKRKFRKLFRSVAIQLFKRSIAVTKVVFEPVTRTRAVNKLIYLGDTERVTLANTLCSLIMNKQEQMIYTADEFEWLAKAIAREAIKEVLNPPELRKEEDDGVARTKIMFYAPKPKSHKKSF